MRDISHCLQDETGPAVRPVTAGRRPGARGPPEAPVQGSGNRMTTNHRLRRSLVGGLAAVLVGATAACGSDPTASGGSNEDGPIKVGVALGLTGPAAATASWSRMGVELAAEQINADGGIDGREVELVIADTELNP